MSLQRGARSAEKKSSIKEGPGVDRAWSMRWEHHLRYERALLIISPVLRVYFSLG
jgi:hypothetical protein